jgi:hypothetical protein
METGRSALTWIRALLKLAADTGERFPEEWAVIERRIESVHSLPVPHDAEPAGAPRLERPDE